MSGIGNIPFVASLQEIVSILDRLAPPRYALGFDKVGLQIAPESREISRVVVSLDRSLAAIDRAIETGANLLLTHHPLIFRPVEKIGDDYEGRAIRKLIRHGIGHFAAHTNWDAAQGGINDALAARLGLTEVTSFGMAMNVERLKLVVFAPANAAEAIIDAAAAAGAGQIGSYRRCFFLGQGEGGFEAPADAKPTVGHPGERTLVEEVRIETVLPATAQKAVARAVRDAHPYEEAALDFLPMAAGPEQALGRVGRIEAMTLAELVAKTDAVLGVRSLAWGDPAEKIVRVAVEGGAADGDWRAAQRCGAQVLITGEVKQHIALEAAESGFALIQAGHYATEQPGVEALTNALQKALPDLDAETFVPPPGSSGRPFWAG
ncbi:Nif3-like dinuclear metal center hexameric protein [bacterium]|nr:MAG: Nif3-like dinuclear metal center hexameric protein [bacterium]